PYSNNATKLAQIKTGSIVMVVAQTKNLNGNLWYMLSDGSWIYSDNVEKTSASNVYYVYNTDGCLMINKAANSKNPISQIPEGGSVIVNTSKSTKSWLYVTYNGVSGYAYKSYLTTTAPQISIYKCNTATNILESAKSSAKKRGTIPANTEFVVFTNRTAANNSYYAVYYNNQIAGYIPKSSAQKVK
ncbi:MAG: hypothetical protein IKZ09_04260, partial [Clostridia bacterium]|nr:hypothetical protein [Clostridia bacterium]